MVYTFTAPLTFRDLQVLLELHEDNVHPILVQPRFHDH